MSLVFSAFRNFNGCPGDARAEKRNSSYTRRRHTFEVARRRMTVTSRIVKRIDYAPEPFREARRDAGLARRPLNQTE